MKTVRLKRIIAEVRGLDPELLGEVLETPGMEDPDYSKVRWSRSVTADGKAEAWEYSCDLEPA